MYPIYALHAFTGWNGVSLEQTIKTSFCCESQLLANLSQPDIALQWLGHIQGYCLQLVASAVDLS
jgi:hypothetical protein